VADDSSAAGPNQRAHEGATLTWEAEADVESGLASFVIERGRERDRHVPEKGKNPFGRPVFQNLQYSDTPTQPLVPMTFTDPPRSRSKARNTPTA